MYLSASLNFTPKSFKICKGYLVYINILVKGSFVLKKFKYFTPEFVSFNFLYLRREGYHWPYRSTLEPAPNSSRYQNCLRRR